jgi:hypothetical protein
MANYRFSSACVLIRIYSCTVTKTLPTTIALSNQPQFCYRPRPQASLLHNRCASRILTTCRDKKPSGSTVRYEISACAGMTVDGSVIPVSVQSEEGLVGFGDVIVDAVVAGAGAVDADEAHRRVGR